MYTRSINTKVQSLRKKWWKRKCSLAKALHCALEAKVSDGCSSPVLHNNAEKTEHSERNDVSNADLYDIICTSDAPTQQVTRH